MRRVFLAVSVCLAALAAGCASTSQTPPPALGLCVDAIQATLNDMDAQVASAAKQMSAYDLASPQARVVLRNLIRRQPLAVDACAVDMKGRMVTVEPAAFAQHEGADISGQAQIIELHRTRAPVFSAAFRAVEGFDAVDLEHPVFSFKGELIGSVSLLFRPETVAAACVAPAVKGLPVEVWLMQIDGRILYDADPEEVGRMLFTDPLYEPYPSLRALGRRIAAEPAGEGSYEFLAQGTDAPIHKQARWSSVELRGVQWRVVMTHPVSPQDAAAASHAPGVPTYAVRLRRLAASPVLSQAMNAMDQGRVIAALKKFYDENPGIHSVQWVSAGHVNRSGYPPANCLDDFDFNQPRTEKDEALLKALRAQAATTFDGELYEGGKARFYVEPVRSAGAYVGAVYVIRLLP